MFVAVFEESAVVQESFAADPAHHWGRRHRQAVQLGRIVIGSRLFSSAGVRGCGTGEEVFHVWQNRLDVDSADAA